MTGFIRRSDRVVFREIKDGGVLLNLDSGDYFSLNSMGCRIWNHAGDTTVEDLKSFVRESLPDAPERMEGEVEEFVQELRSRGLIEFEDVS